MPVLSMSLLFSPALFDIKVKLVTIRPLLKLVNDYLYGYIASMYSTTGPLIAVIS